jgi:hypothetical protein
MKLTESRIKQIIKEEMDLMEMEADPYTIMIGAGAAYALYKMFFGREPSSTEEALEGVRERTAQLEQEASELEKKNKGRFGPSPASDLQRIKAKRALKRLKKERGEI